MRKWIPSCLMLFFFFTFFIFKDEVIAGASDGLLLWYRFVLPSLLPFMILVNVMMHTDAVSLLSKLLGPLMKRFPGVSPAGSFAVLCGFLCGYPMGAKVSADLVADHRISYTEGSYLLSFCNNTSPMFVLGILLSKFIPEKELHLPFFLILFLSPLLCGQLFRIYYTHRNAGSFTRDTLIAKHPLAHKRDSFPKLLDACLMDAFQGIVKVGMYMMLFSILIRILAERFPGHSLAKAICLSSLEVTTGLSLLAGLQLTACSRYILLMAAASFGGFCAVFQTASMTQDSGLKLLPYITEKLITATVTSLLAYLYLRVFCPLA